MDPNRSLREMLEMAQRIAFDPYDRYDAETVRLAELVIALDEWIRKQNVLPSAWRSK